MNAHTPQPLRISELHLIAAVTEKAALAEADALLGDRGRMVVRKSGTEPLIRVMAEALAEAQMLTALGLVVDAVNAELARYETIKRFQVLSPPLTVESGLLTPTLKVRRSIVEKSRAHVIDAIYTR